VAPFDRKNKQQVQTWFVTVRNAEKLVRIYCPECWGKATKVVEEYYGNKQQDQ
jgi:hypothetical protein